MSIPQQSRYADGTITRIPDFTGTYQRAVLRTVPATIQSFRPYVWQTGNRPDLVAAALLGDSTLWWMIFDINPEIIDPLNVAPGTVVRVPLDGVNPSSTVLQ